MTSVILFLAKENAASGLLYISKSSVEYQCEGLKVNRQKDKKNRNKLKK